MQKAQTQSTKQIDVLESQVLSKFNEGHKTFDDLLNVVQFSEQTLVSVMENLIAKNVFRLNTSTKQYEYLTPLKGDTIILDGNFMLPTTVIELDDSILITRGKWYRFPKDFDIRSIIWNIVLPDKNNSTLVSLIKESTLTTRKTKNVQLPEYKNLVNKLIPWNNDVKFEILCVGEEVTDISIIFCDKVVFGSENDYVLFDKFQVRSTIQTNNLIDVLRVSHEYRDFQDIKLNRLYNFSEFIFRNNCIPYNKTDEGIEYIKISSIQKQITITYYLFNNQGIDRKVNEDVYIDISEGLDVIKTLFNSYTESLLAKNEFLMEHE